MKDIKNIIDSNDINKLKMLACTSEHMLKTIEKLDESKYGEYELEIYEIINGKKISEEIATTWVESMLPYGMKWSMEETTQVMRDKGLNFEPVEFYVVMNMIFNDYNNIVLDNLDTAVEMTKDWLNDKDAKENKLYNYYKYVV